MPYCKRCGILFSRTGTTNEKLCEKCWYNSRNLKKLNKQKRKEKITSQQIYDI